MQRLRGKGEAMMLIEMRDILQDLARLKRAVSAAIAKDDANEINRAGRAFDRACDRAPWREMIRTIDEQLRRATS